MRLIAAAVIVLSCIQLNAQSSVPKTPTLYCDLSTTGVASFCIQNHKAGSVVVEYSLWGRWVRFDTVCTVAAGTYTCMSAEYQLHSGLNQIRFFIDDGITSTYDVTSSTAKCTITDSTYSCNNLPVQTLTDIQLPRKTYFELYNEKGGMVKRGWADSVSKAGLSKGTYKLHYENCTMEFVVVE